MKSKSLGFYFTLIELLVAMAVFSLIMVTLMGFFNSAQKVFSNFRKKTTMYADADVALGLVERDLQSMLYGDEFPFYTPDPDTLTDTDKICFISNSALVTDSYCKTAEIVYDVAEMDSATNGVKVYWLTVNVTPKSSGNYDAATQKDKTTFDTSDAAEKVIPYVTKLDFKCYDANGGLITNDYPVASGDDANRSICPSKVTMDLEILDRDSWLKWKATGSDAIKNQNKRTFSKTIFLGERF